MKFGLFYELQLPKPLDNDQWDPDDERRIIHEALDQIEFADRLGFDYVFEVEHHFLEEYSHSSAPEVVLAAASQRTKNIRLGHGIVHMPPRVNHPARVAERIATLDLVSDGRVEFGTGEGASDMELGGFGTPRELKKEAWEEALRECVRMMTSVPYEGYEGVHFGMPVRNVIPKPLQKPHPPVWVAASRRETFMVAGRLGIAPLGFGFETPEEAAERIERYYELVRECRRPIGAALNPAVATVGNLMCARTDEEAIERGLSGAQFFGYSLGRGTPPNPPRNPGRDHLYREFRQRFDAAQTEAARDAATAQEPADESARALYRAGRRGGFMGSPEFIRNNLRRYEAAHLDAMIFIAQCGDRKHEHIMESLELFAKEVMPEFKERHREHQKWRERQLDGVKFPVNSTI
ncbi:MAG TPA: LLM class flavin-dependent oxidoreductase [Dehalococcoidia bacterium]|nr:LLM class flavin-dependent oxidoreductase [Dehalococcoidia bacterium]